MFDVLLRIFIIGSMMFFLPNLYAYGPQEMFFQYGIMALLGMAIINQKKREISNKYLGLLFIYILAQTIIFHFNPVSRMYLANIFLGLVGIKLISEYSNLNIKSYGILLYMFAMFNTGWIGLQLLNKDPIFQNIYINNMPQVDIVGFMGSRFCLGILAALITPFVYRVNRLLPLTLLPLLYFGKSSTCIATYALTYGFLLTSDACERIEFVNKTTRRVVKGIVISVPILLLLAAVAWYTIYIDAPTGQFSKRLVAWSACIQFWKHNFWFGMGGGTWATMNIATIQKNGQPEVWRWVHNDFLQFLFSYGVVGGVFLLAYLKNLFKKINLKIYDHRIVFSSFIALCLVAFFHFPFHARFCGLAIFILALLEAILNEKNTRTISSINS